MLVRPDHGAVEDHPLQVGVLQRLEDPLPDPLLAPAVEPLPDRAPGPEPLGQVAPRGAGLGDPEHGVDEEAVVLGGHARVPGLAGEEVFDAIPVVIRDLVAAHRERSGWPYGVRILAYPAQNPWDLSTRPRARRSDRLARARRR